MYCHLQFSDEEATTHRGEGPSAESMAPVKKGKDFPPSVSFPGPDSFHCTASPFSWLIHSFTSIPLTDLSNANLASTYCA